MKHIRTAIILAAFVSWSVAAVLIAAPRFTNSMLRGSSFIMGGLGGSNNGAYAILSSTNLSLPLTNWTAASTNSFDGNGRFNLTNPLNPAVKQQFYALQNLPAANALWVPICGAWMGAYPSGGAASSYSNLESQIGRKLDIYRTYHPPTPVYTALSSEELNYITNGNKMMTSFRPGPLWSDASGGNPTVNAQLASLAKSVASVKPYEIMISIWPEPESDVIPTGTNGTTADFVAMWRNVRNIFNANGATNVIWCWDIQMNPTWYGLYPGLWPGNTNVDWVGYDVYQSSATEDYVAKQISRYNWLTANSTSTCTWTNKPWAWFEWGVGLNSYHPTVADETNGINAINTAINNRQFPRVACMIWFDSGPSTLLAGTMSSFSNYARSPYMEQECPP
jgi:hypothetical protein